MVKRSAAAAPIGKVDVNPNANRARVVERILNAPFNGIAANI
jgi:hypothetical protein